jgi:hypothetical protein
MRDLTLQVGGGLEYLHRSPESQEAMKREPSARGYNCVTLFLGDNGPPGSGESQMRQ